MESHVGQFTTLSTPGYREMPKGLALSAPPRASSMGTITVYRPFSWSQTV